MIIYYVGVEVDFNSQQLLFRHFGTLMPRPHATLVYSRKWFPYKTVKCFPLIIEPPYSYRVLEENLVLKFENHRFFQRYIELRNLGATSDYDHFISHITIGPISRWEVYDQIEFLTHAMPPPKFPITLSNEYYGTWEEGKN
jgi:hypothetical protein